VPPTYSMTARSRGWSVGAVTTLTTMPVAAVKSAMTPVSPPVAAYSVGWMSSVISWAAAAAVPHSMVNAMSAAVARLVNVVVDLVMWFPSAFSCRFRTSVPASVGSVNHTSLRPDSVAQLSDGDLPGVRPPVGGHQGGGGACCLTHGHAWAHHARRAVGLARRGEAAT